MLLAITALAAPPSPAPAQTHAAKPVAHGLELEAAKVGPLAAGYTGRPIHRANEIRDGRPYPFARDVAESAVYDGYPVAGPHLLIEGVILDGPVDIYARRPVVFRGASVRTNATAHWALHTRPETGPVLFLWSEAGALAEPTQPLERGLYLRGDGAIVHRSHVRRTADGIQIHGRGTRIVETLVDELMHWPGQHNDGIQLLGRAEAIEIARSRIENRNPQTSCLNLAGTRIRIEASYLSGGGWTLYAGAHIKGHVPGTRQEIVVRDTVFGREHFPKGGHFGLVTGWDGAPGTGNVWSGNRLATGEPVAPPGAAAALRDRRDPVGPTAPTAPLPRR